MIRNIAFDLAGVVFARSRTETPARLLEFFSFINSGETMPHFWQNYDRGTETLDEVAAQLASYRGSSFMTAREYMLEAVLYQRTVEPTASMMRRLSERGFHLFALSNMSRDYIEFLRNQEVYSLFEGDVISCEVGFCKPEHEIFETFLKKFSLSPTETLFIDDRRENVEGAIDVGMKGFHFDRTNPESSCTELSKMLL